MQARLFALLGADARVIATLETVRRIGPAGAYVAAGFVRNRVWDSFYADGRAYPDLDIDVVYFDANETGKAPEARFEAALEAALPCGLWQVRNQARMHEFGGHPPFSDMTDALMHWAETATTVGVRLDAAGHMEAIAPFGFDDLFSHILRITPVMKRHDPMGFDARLARKKWQARWPNLTVIRD